MKQTAIALLITTMFTGAAMAQQAEDKIEEVKVTGAKDPEFKTYKPFILGLDAFDKYKTLAPTAPLRFILRTLDPKINYEGVTMRIAGNEESLAVPVAPDGTFSMPRNQALADEDAEIILNRKKGVFRWRPSIYTPGLAENTRRLGDLRLECEVRWAVERPDLPFFIRTMFSAMGGPCGSARVRVMQVAPRELAAVHLVSGDKRLDLDKKQFEEKNRGYVVPLHDKAWPDDTLIELEFANKAD
jgi:hypothetical protein